MVYEHEAHILDGTWEVSTLPQRNKFIGSRWIYKIKYHSNAKVGRHKSHVVALGNRQREGLDNTDTFVTVAKPSTVHVLLEIVAAKK